MIHIGIKKQSRKLLIGGLLVIGFIAAGAGIFHVLKTDHNANAYLNGFDPGNIISDFVMSNKNTMSEADINNFLHSKNPCNDRNLAKANGYWHLGYTVRDGHFVCMADENFGGESAAHIIWQAAQDYSINPQVLIVTLQKEQNLVLDTWPNHNLQYASATGFGCPDTGNGCNPVNSGFKNQVRQAAALFRDVLNGGWSTYPAYTWQDISYKDRAPQCGKAHIYIQNRATSALYRYTPYVPNQAALNAGYAQGDACSAYGNRNFYNYFTDWFGNTQLTAESNIWLPDGTYRLKTSNGKNLDVAGVSTSDGGNVWIWDTNYAGGQEWEVKRGDDGYYTLRNPHSNKYLDVSGGRIANGTNVDIWSYNTTCAQKWAITTNGSGYRLQSACSGKSLDIEGGNLSSGVNVRVWDNNNADAQRWWLEKTDSPIVTAGTYNLSVDNGRRLDIAGVGTNNGANVWLWDANNAGGQDWEIAMSDDGLYTLRNPHSGKYLDVTAAGTINGSNIQIWQGTGSCAQKWLITKNGNGYRLRSSCSGRSLDVSGNILDNGQNVWLWDNNDAAGQRWYLVKNTPPRTVADGTYRLKTSNGKNLDVAGVSTSDGGNVWLWDTNYAGGQEWEIKRGNDGYYTLRNPHSNRYLDVSGGRIANGTNVDIWSYNTTCAQKWAITTNGNGYRLQSACSGKSLDIEGGNLSSGINVRVWDNNNADAQRWWLEKL